MTSSEVRRSQYNVIIQLGLRKQFLDSNYSSYGWFLRSLGIVINSEGIHVLDDSEYKPKENLIKIYAIYGDLTL